MSRAFDELRQKLDKAGAELTAVAGAERVHAATCDIREPAQVADFVGAVLAKWGRLDVLFNCAGFVHNGPILQATDDERTFAFNLNVRAQFWMIQAVLPKMLAGGGGSIINMASVCGSLKGLPLVGDFIPRTDSMVTIIAGTIAVARPRRSDISPALARTRSIVPTVKAR